MTEELLINVGIRETRIALVSDGRLDEVFVERGQRESVAGSIYLGRVNRVVPAMAAAFVDVGLARHGFLSARQAGYGRGRSTAADNPPPRIADLVAEGEAIVVQAVSEPTADKGARLTTDLTLPGRVLVHAPWRDGVAVARRIDDDAERDRLSAAVAALRGEEPSLGGIIVRTAAWAAAPAALSAEVSRLADEWDDFQARRQQCEAPALIHRDLDPVSRALRDHMTGAIERVLIDSAEGVALATRYGQAFMPDLAPRITRHDGPPSLFELYDVEAGLEAALAARVALPSGGSICIQRTEALTAVDINTARFVAAPNAEEAAFRTNLEAAPEIARQIRLRNIGGMIVIDFIQMAEHDHAERVLAALEAALARDRAPTRLGALAEFGLAAVTRKRTRGSLAQLYQEDCGACGGGGRLKMPGAVAAEILRRVEAEASAAPAPGFTIVAAPEVADDLLQRDGADIAAVRQRTGRIVEVRSDPARARDEYDIVAM